MGKGQAAIEFVTTYGWAIVIVAIVVSLLYIVSTLPTSATPTSCSFESAVFCSDIVGESNTLTLATTLTVYLTNSQAYPVANPYMFAKIGGTNTTGVACSPNYVLSGGTMLCALSLSSVRSSVGQLLQGQLYLNATYCGLQPNYSQSNMCSLAPKETYVGTFRVHTQV